MAGGGVSTIAVLGMPNTGKSTLFNQLTGSQAHIGNWPGITVDLMQADVDLQGTPAQLVDLPGIYDLRAHRDEVLMPILRYWGIFELSGLDAAAEEARKRLHEHLEKLEASAKRFEERLAASTVPRLRPLR